MPRVTVIPPTINMATKMPTTSVKKRKVAAYARVSTDSAEQHTSYEAQVDYYTNYIKNNAFWDFSGIYTDEGISAVNTKKREGFNRMIGDALDGKIDLIVTKSVSRFARNTVDSLTTVRKLKEKGVEVYFEKENIYTLDSKGELLITIMSSLAQEESRSISENVTWGQRKRFADGKISLPYNQFLGYRKGDDGLPKIVPEEAEIVRLIYRSFMNGMTTTGIAKMLTGRGILTPAKKTEWQASTVKSILTNEKYKGAALLQKQFTVDFLTKKMKVNEGEIPQYYVENSHEAIISEDEFDLVQTEFEKRKALGKQYSGNSPFSSKIVCHCCGGFYGSKVWHSTSKYRRVIWQCNRKFKNGEKCKTPHLTEDLIKEKFLLAYHRLFQQKNDVISACKLIQKTLSDCSEIDAKLHEILQEMEEIASLTKQLISENSTQTQDQDEYLERYENFVQRYEIAKSKTDALQLEKSERITKKEVLRGFIAELSNQTEVLTEFDSHLWNGILERVTVFEDGKLKFLFKDGTDIFI